MLKFTGGPAQDSANGLLLKRAPLFLRVVVNDRGEWDALDQLTDRPNPRETIYVYRRVGDHVGFCCIRGGKGSGCFVIAEYQYVDPQPADAIVRDTAKWRAWASEQVRKEAPPP